MRQVLCRSPSRQYHIHKVNTFGSVHELLGFYVVLGPLLASKYYFFSESNVISETLCERNFTNGAIAATCGIKVGDSCHSITCNYGFQTVAVTGLFNCTENGTWDYNLTLKCIGA